MKKRYFKIKTGFKDEDFISITEDELETAMYAFLTDSKAVFNNGVVNGKNILEIKEDWHKEFGWNPGYKLQPEDYAEIRAKAGHYTGLLAKVKENVLQLIANNETFRIGTTDYSEVRGLSDGGENTGLQSLRPVPKTF